MLSMMIGSVAHAVVRCFVLSLLHYCLSIRCTLAQVVLFCRVAAALTPCRSVTTSQFSHFSISWTRV